MILPINSFTSIFTRLVVSQIDILRIARIFKQGRFMQGLGGIESVTPWAGGLVVIDAELTSFLLAVAHGFASKVVVGDVFRIR